MGIISFALDFQVVLGFGRIAVKARADAKAPIVVVGGDEGAMGMAPEGAFEDLAARILAHPSLAGADPAAVRWIWRRPPFLFRGRRHPEAWFGVRMVWDSRARRYRNARWSALRGAEEAEARALWNGQTARD